MPYPSRTEYIQAVRDYPHVSMLDPTLKGGMPQRGSDNHLIYDSGNFSIVFPIEAESRTYALRCWIRNVGDVGALYEEISTYLKLRHLPYFIDFEYVPEGILVNGTRYPITRMEWAEGETLRDFIEQNLQNPWLLKTAATKFRKMVATLHTHQISHGDLQDGNILLKRNGADVEIKLIDYDSLFVPSLRGQPDTILGLPEYQHPQREAEAGDAREKVDYFSELVIYLSFVALAEKPELWSRFGGRTEKGLLFTAEDFRNPDESEVFRALENLSPNVRQLASKLKEFCAKPSIDQLEPLEAVVPIADFLASVWKLFSKNKLATVLAICVVAFYLQMNAKNGAIRQNLKLENQLASQGTELTSLESKNQELSNENKTLRKQLAKAKLLDGTWYIVKKGDTLYGIARKHNVSWSSIRNANPKLRSGLPIQPKQKLFIPGPHAIGFKAPLPDPKQVALEAKNAKLLRENLKLEIENIALQKQLDEVTKPDSKQVALDNKNTELREKNQTLQNENQKLRLEKTALEKQLNKSKPPDSKQVTLDNENTELREKNRTLQNENQKLRLEKTALRKQLDKAKQPDSKQVNNDIFENDAYFTVGSTKDKVVAVQGTPNSFTGNKFEYGYSTVHFRNDRVTSWYNSNANPLKAKMVPAKGTRNRGYFTTGSTKDEVVAVQGTPNSFTGNKFEYGYSTVHFRNGRVTSWYNSNANPLKAKMVPAKGTRNRGYFTTGSTKDKVVAVQGTPNSFTGNKFEYGYSTVHFRNGRVTSWYNSNANPLKAKMVPAKGTRNRGYFTTGSTKDEVVAVQGTPNSFTGNKFEYGYSTVHFRNGRVTSWYNSNANPLKAKMVPAKGTRNRGYFTTGSTKDEVVAVQGTPNSFTGNKFEYGYSTVHFRNDRVTSWYNSNANPLKVR